MKRTVTECDVCSQEITEPYIVLYTKMLKTEDSTELVIDGVYHLCSRDHLITQLGELMRRIYILRIEIDIPV